MDLCAASGRGWPGRPGHDRAGGAAMKRENPDLYAALLLGVLLHTLLCAQARYGARAGLLALPFSAAALTLAAVLFARAWRQLEGLRAPRWGLAAVLAASSA